MENKITLNGVEVRTKDTEHGEYLCITDLAKVVGDHTGTIIGKWLRLINTIEYLKEWEIRYNGASFNVPRYEYIRKHAGTLSFSLSSKKWINETNAIGIISVAGRYGGTYAHNAIALEFCAAISPAFKLGVYVDYIDLKEEKTQQWLKTYQFYLQKMKDNSLENNQLAQELQHNLKQLNGEE